MRHSEPQGTVSIFYGPYRGAIACGKARDGAHKTNSEWGGQGQRQAQGCQYYDGAHAINYGDVVVTEGMQKQRMPRQEVGSDERVEITHCTQRNMVDCAPMV